MKRILLILSCLILIQLACSIPLVATPTSKPSDEPTLVVAPEGPIAVETPSPTEFRDEFENSLDPGWSWMNEAPADWSLTVVPGSLQIAAGKGHVKQGTISNLLLHSIPAGNFFEIETKLTFQPKSNFQFAGLLVYESSSSFMQAGRAYCGSSVCVGDGLYFDLTENGAFIPPNHATKAPSAATVYLRLRRDGSTYTFSYSQDGQTWTTVGEHSSSITPRFVGLAAGQSESGSLPAIFDYFRWSIQTQDA